MKSPFQHIMSMLNTVSNMKCLIMGVEDSLSVIS